MNIFALSLPRICRVTGCLLASLALAFSAHGVVLSVAPGSVSNTYAGQITLQITGLNSGETVLVERFVDANLNGTIDASDWLFSSFLLTDGQVTSFGGVRNINIPGDNDAVAGQITTLVSFPNSPELSRVSGAQLVRVSSPTSRFTPVVKPLTVTQFPYSQSITGKVMNGASPVPNAGVGLLVPVGSDVVFLEGTIADASGNFSLAAAPSNYVIFAVKPGYVSPFGSPFITLSPGQNLATNLNMTPGPYTISGKVSDASSGIGLAGIQLLFQSTNGLGALGFTDAGGNFSIPVTPNQWKFDLSDYTITDLGYLRPQNKLKISVGAGNVTGTQVPLTKMTAMVYGTVKNDTNAPLPGIKISDSDNVGLYQGAAYTDANGNYSIGVLAGGNWYVAPDTSQAALAGYSVNSTNVTLATGAALQVNFVAQAASAHLIGHVFSNGVPVAGVTIMATPQGGGPSAASVVTGADGSFNLGVPGGDWILALETTSAASLNLIGPNLEFNIANGTTISGITYIAQIVTASITGVVRDSASNAISGIFVFVNGTINGTNYNAGTQTDANGNYNLGVFNGVWQVSPDCGGLNSLGYGCPNNQTVTINNSGAVANFIVPPPPSYSLFFRHFANGGDFANGFTMVPPYPISPMGYNAVLLAQNDANYPPLGNVFFTGPAGSGMTNSPTGIQNANGNSVAYISVKVKHPPSAPGGNWSVNYNGNMLGFTAPDPQVAAHLVLPVPTVSVNNGILTRVTWAYTDANGNPLTGTPALVTNLQVQLFDQTFNGLDASAVLPPSVMSYTPLSTNPWSNVGIIRMFYTDNLNNRYVIDFNHAAPQLAAAGWSANNRFQLLLTGLVGQNYTVQFSTDLANWSPLLITNAPGGPFIVPDPVPPGAKGFYRVLLGP